MIYYSNQSGASRKKDMVLFIPDMDRFCAIADVLFIWVYIWGHKPSRHRAVIQCCCAIYQQLHARFTHI